MAVFLRQCHFQDLPFFLKSHNLRTENFPLFRFPGKVSTLCKAKPAWIKRSIQLRNFAALQSGGATRRNTSRPQTWLLIQKEQILKITLPQKNGSRIKTPSSKLTILVSSCWEKHYTNNNAHKFFILFLVFLNLLIGSVAFFLGHPV